MNDLPCRVSADLSREMDAQDAADVRQAELEARYPVESYMAEAEHYALGEGTPELVNDFQTAHSDTAYRLLMFGSGQADALEIPDYAERLLIVDHTCFYLYRKEWIKEYAEVLRQEQIEAAR